MLIMRLYLKRCTKKDIPRIRQIESMPIEEQHYNCLRIFSQVRDVTDKNLSNHLSHYLLH